MGWVACGCVCVYWSTRLWMVGFIRRSTQINTNTMQGRARGRVGVFGVQRPRALPGLDLAAGRYVLCFVCMADSSIRSTDDRANEAKARSRMIPHTRPTPPTPTQTPPRPSGRSNTWRSDCSTATGWWKAGTGTSRGCTTCGCRPRCWGWKPCGCILGGRYRGDAKLIDLLTRWMYH